MFIPPKTPKAFYHCNATGRTITSAYLREGNHSNPLVEFPLAPYLVATKPDWVTDITSYLWFMAALKQNQTKLTEWLLAAYKLSGGRKTDHRGDKSLGHFLRPLARKCGKKPPTEVDVVMEIIKWANKPQTTPHKLDHIWNNLC